jgi:hypothetical protein
MSTAIITGSRDLTNRQKFSKEQLAQFKAFVFNVLDGTHALSPITLLVQGGAEGADLLAAQWAHQNNIPCVTVEAEWHLHGKSAGPKRNRKMLLAYPDARVIGFPMGESRGTRGCLKMAREFGMRVVEYGL